ncbi:Protein phosphatase 2C [Chitinophaga sp. CF118]|uniref:PP2C family serine/threonine-protein phosphatase n=1 Tax=Chitinophaga sp. CF118 TaxID=1884367 RepID=UPI0008E68591|nr:PP2C family serine/threonine-protein phosphatase [Chitinophaga sp. CF118]SFE29225.1 Protein phosphatase 2C [Chitinophaga sp. CF118]
MRKLIEKLLREHQLPVKEKQQLFFDGFLATADIQQAAEQMLNAQNFIVESWKEKSLTDDIVQKHVAIPNAKVNKPYHFPFDAEALGLHEMGDYKWEIPEGLGITFEKEKALFTGIPQQQGEFILTLLFRLRMSPADKPFSEKKIRLIINPDPKSLWKDLPSDEQDPYWQPDSEAMTASFGDRTLLIASKRGRSHAHEGKFRDDSFASSFDQATGWGIIAVADGAGSAKYSRRGAVLACNAVVESFSALLASEKMISLETAIAAYMETQSEESQVKVSGQFIEQLGKIAFSAQQKIRQEALSKQAEIKDYATTLIFTLVKKYASGYVISSFWVGDGGIGIYNNTDAIVLGTPDSGEFAGQTRFLTMQDIFADNAYINRIRFKVVPDFTALILMTDGITDPKFQTDANLRNVAIWQKLWQDLEGNNEDGCKVDFNGTPEKAKEELLNWLDFWSPGNHDDRTIAILY